MNPSVEFDENDIREAEEMVRIREWPKREMTVPSQKVSKNRTDQEIDLLGILAEMAIAKLLGVSLEKKRMLTGDNGYDILWKNRKVEVKYTYHTKGHLMVRSKERLKADLYILLTGNEKKMRVLGWIDKQGFLGRGTLKDFGYGPNFVIEQNELYEWDEVKC